MRWKYVYYFLIVTFLVVIFVSLITISITMFLNEQKQKPTTFSVDAGLESLTTSNTDDNEDYTSSSSDISIDPTTKISLNLYPTDNNRNILTSTIKSIDSESNSPKKNPIGENFNSSSSGSDKDGDPVINVATSTNIVDKNRNSITVIAAPTDPVSNSPAKNPAGEDSGPTTLSHDKIIDETTEKDPSTTPLTNDIEEIKNDPAINPGSTDTTTREPEIKHNSDTDNKSEKFINSIEKSTPIPDESISWLDVHNTRWNLPIFYRNVSESPSIWIYRCSGTLIHPKAVLSVHLCVQVFSSGVVLYAVRIFDRMHNTNEVTVNDYQIYDQLSLTDYNENPLMKITFTKNNKTYDQLHSEFGFIVLMTKRPIDCIKPVDVSRTSLMPIHDILDDTIEKECIHITYVKDRSQNNRYFEYKTSKKFIDHKEIIELYKIFLAEKFNNQITSIDFLEDISNFGTPGNVNITSIDQKHEMLGSPLACRLMSDKLDHFSFAGLLSNSFYGDTYNYVNIHHDLKWIQERLNK